jgi:hypothetical protein
MIASDRRRDVFDALDDIERQHGIDLRRSCTVERADHDRAALATQLAKDPIIRRYFEAGRVHNPLGLPEVGMPRITEPWMALAEQRVWAAGLAGRPMPVEIRDGYPEEPQTIKRMRMAALLLCSQTFLWSTEVFATIRACPLPRHVIARDILPFPFTYHTTEVSYSLERTADNGVDAGPLPPDPATDWMALFDVPNHHAVDVSINVSGQRVDDRPVIVKAGIHYGQTYPDDLSETARQTAHLVLSMLAFLNSPFAGVEHQRIPRAMRRHGGVAPADVDSTIAVVVLRREAREAVEAYNAESRSWKHRWWVSGHFRRQWQPSKQTHEVIWIAPFLKGPADAPMLDKVFAVRR